MQLYISEKSNAPQAVDTISGGSEVISAAMPIQTGHSRVGDLSGLSLKYSHSSQKKVWHVCRVGIRQTPAPDRPILFSPVRQ